MTENKTATECLRELLDARGVEWVDQFGPFPVTAYETNDVVWFAKEYMVGMFSVETRPITPEQAIAATLGRVECECESSLLWDCYHGRDFYEHRLSCGHIIASGFEEPPNYCEECGAKVRKSVKR